MFPSSALHVVERTPSKLVILNPPYYWVGGIFLVVGLFIVAAIFIPQNGPALSGSTKLIGVLFAVPFLAVAAWILTSRTTVTFSRDTGEMTVDQAKFGFRHSRLQIPIQAVDKATVAPLHAGSWRLEVMLRSGEPVMIGGQTTQKGYFDAAKAINDFLRNR
ncbi:MAG: hypothetical protein ACRD18_03985 [Terriglobia bacterium]